MDNKTTLDLADDAAHANLGGNWRMPTNEDWTELRTECTWVWSEYNGVSGCLVIGPNSKTIFLPAAGYRGYTNILDPVVTGTYLSSALNTTENPTIARGVFIYSDGFLTCQCRRYCGYTVRPVIE